MDILVLFIAFAVILLGAELFTNGIEWFGHKLGLAEGAVGSVLAAVGTALPETMIPIIAILFASNGGSDEIGVGAILGAPFMLATLAMFVTAVAVLFYRQRRKNGAELAVSTSVLGHDMRFFAVAYALAIGAAFLPADVAWPKWIVAVALILIYGYYVREHLVAEGGGGEPDLAPLRIRRLDRGGDHSGPPRLRIVNVQVIAALACIVGGAYLFVGAVEHIATELGADQVLLALVIAPIATELPEKFNSVLWVRQGKDTLALGNLTGAMVFQSTIPTVIALVFASSAWSVQSGSVIAFASAGIAFLSAGFIFIPMVVRHRLSAYGMLIGGFFYVLYLGLVLASMGSHPA